MTTKYSWLAGALGVALAACSSPHLALVNSQALDIPAGTGIVLGAFVQDSNGQVLWSLDGPGVLTPTTGLQVVYYAPPTYPTSGPTTATVTLQLTGSPDETKAYQITITKPSNTIGGIANLQAQVDVGYDTRSIPTINCVAPADCYAVLGYIHARDRFFEMDFLRRAARGTLSELIGGLAVDQDTSIRTVFTVPVPGSSPAAAAPLPDQLATYLRADPLIGPLYEAYVAGVNKRIAEMRADPTQLPAEYSQLLYSIDPTSTTDLPDWTDVDTTAILRGRHLREDRRRPVGGGVRRARRRPDGPADPRLDPRQDGRPLVHALRLRRAQCPTVPCRRTLAVDDRAPAGHGPGAPAGEGPGAADGRDPPSAG